MYVTFCSTHISELSPWPKHPPPSTISSPFFSLRPKGVEDPKHASGGHFPSTARGFEMTLESRVAGL